MAGDKGPTGDAGADGADGSAYAEANVEFRNTNRTDIGSGRNQTTTNLTRELGRAKYMDATTFELDEANYRIKVKKAGRYEITALMNFHAIGTAEATVALAASLSLNIHPATGPTSTPMDAYGPIAKINTTTTNTPGVSIYLSAVVDLLANDSFYVSFTKPNTGGSSTARTEPGRVAVRARKVPT